MKYILVINTVEYIVGGISTVIMNYFAHIDHSKFRLDFVVNNYAEQKYLQVMEKYNANVFIMDRNGDTLRYFLRLMRLIRKHRYDIIHVHGNSCTMAVELLAGKLAGCPVRIAHGHSTACQHIKMHRLLRPIFEWTCTKRIACSMDAGRWLFQGKEFEVLKNGLNIDKYQFNPIKRMEIRTRLGILDNEILLGNVGILNKQKNQKYLLKVLHELCKSDSCYKLVLVGEGELEGQIREEAAKLQDRVILYGVTDDVPGILSAMDIFVFPSVYEGLGIAALEAQLSGLPCVASDVVPDDVAVGENICFLPIGQNDIQLWSEKIQEFSRLRIDRGNSYGKDGGRIKKYDIGNCVGQLEDIYEGCHQTLS